MHSLFFSNPAGLWALLGLPAVVLIHFLQRESRRARISTLFLLEQLAPESAQGRRFERLRHSASLWLQLLAVMLLAWLLAGPRWIRRDSVQSIAVVLDSSASMSAFASEAKRVLGVKLPALSAAAARSNWTLLESDPARRVLYSGSDFAAMFTAWEDWHPNLGVHDAGPALRAARSVVRNRGLVVFVTDHAEPPSPGVAVLALGSPFDNAGFTGLQADEKGWRVLVKNYGAQSARREWKIDGQPSGVLDVAPGAIQELRGDFPAQIERLTLSLEPDRFAMDDTLPLVRPQLKRLGIAPEPGTPFEEFFQKFRASVEHQSPDGRDLSLLRYDPLLPHDADGAGIVFLDQPGQAGKLSAEPVIARNHPLVAGLSWQGLQANETFSIVPRDSDEWLVSQGSRPLLLLRWQGRNPVLLVNFDLRYSNAARLPAFVLTLNRFAEMIRAGLPGTEVVNAETGQILPDESRAPNNPGFFERPTIRGAAYFADAREADFREAVSADGLQNAAAELRNRNSEQDFLAPLWLLLLLLTIGLSWLAAGHREKLNYPRIAQILADKTEFLKNPRTSVKSAD